MIAGYSGFIVRALPLMAAERAGVRKNGGSFAGVKFAMFISKVFFAEP